MTLAVTVSRTPLQPADDAPHLLLVDDDRRIRDLLSRFLLAEGYRVTTAMSASDARAKLAGLHFDLLILDVMMPGETGFDLARFIRTTSAVPIVMLTAHGTAPTKNGDATKASPANKQKKAQSRSIGANNKTAKTSLPR